MKRKIHIIWAQNTTFCGRSATEADIHSADDAPYDERCIKCSKSARAAFPPGNIYNTTGAFG